MKRILLALIVAVACAVERKPAPVVPDGDWVSINYPHEMIRYTGLQFKNEDFYLVNDSGKTWMGKCLLSGDTLMVKDEDRKFVRYIIRMQGIDTLWLIGSEQNMLYRKSVEDNDKLRLNEVRLVAGSCFFACPSFELTVADGVPAKYVGGENSKFKGEKLLAISPEEWNTLDTLFRWSKIVSCDTVLEGVADDWSFHLEVTYNEGQHKKIRTSQLDLLPRMKPFVEKLIQIVKKADLI